MAGVSFRSKDERLFQPFAVRRVRIETEDRRVSLPVDVTPSATPIHTDIGTDDRSFDAARGRLVLLVTDDAGFREVTERALRREGFRVAMAAHAGHALLACLGDTRFDVLVTELSMGDMSGPALAERVRRYQPGLPVVYVGATGTPECEGVLVHPFTRDDLVRQIDLALTDRDAPTASAALFPAS